ELRLPGGVELPCGERVPRRGIERLAIVLLRPFQLEGQRLQVGKRRREGPQVVDFETVALRRLGIRGPLHVGRTERRVLADRIFVVHAPELALGVRLREIVSFQVEGLQRVRAGFEAADRREIERLARTGPGLAARGWTRRPAARSTPGRAPAQSPPREPPSAEPSHSSIPWPRW